MNRKMITSLKITEDDHIVKKPFCFFLLQHHFIILKKIIQIKAFVSSMQFTMMATLCGWQFNCTVKI